MTCPRCNADLTPAEVRSLNGKLNASLIRKRSGPKVWRKHRAGYSRCRCKKCNARRERWRMANEKADAAIKGLERLQR